MSTRKAGHGLRHEGRPVLVAGCCGADRSADDRTRNPYDQIGHVLCECGSVSPCESTTAARQRWHRQHNECP